MYTTPTLIQSTCSSSDATTWHPDQVHLPIFNSLHFTLSVGGEEVPCNLKGMYAQVRDVIARCEQCDRVRTSFSSRQLTLSPLPIQGMYYRLTRSQVTG
jgi:hypothetical protein